MTVSIREAVRTDTPSLRPVLEAVLEEGATYPHDNIEAFMSYWLSPQARTFVAEADGQLLGSYVLRANQPGRGSHVANAGFVVAPSARGLGVGQKLGEHALTMARSLGYEAMQFNLVVETNTASLRLWAQLGFSVVGRLPGAFDHRDLGKVDALVLHRQL